MRIVIVAAAVFATALAGCGQRGGNASEASLPTPGPRPGGNAGAGSDQAMRQSFRTLGIETCLSSARTRFAQGGSASPAPDFRPYCTCSIDRLMAGHSVEELTSLRPGPREQEIAEQCARETGLGSAGETGSGTDDGGNGGK